MTQPRRFVVLCLSLVFRLALSQEVQAADGRSTPDRRLNILFAIADDWGWPHAGAYGDAVVRTPTFDRLAREGTLYRQAYISAPSCTASRGALLTGQWHWRLGGAANLWSIFPDQIVTYPDRLTQSGYFCGMMGKGWGPGRTETPTRPIAGQPFRNFKMFLGARPAGKPFCFWLGGRDPHRPYEAGTGQASGHDLSLIRLPACFPDEEVVRSDVADYYFEVERFDSLVGDALRELEQRGELDRTVVIMTSDHGMPFPRCKANLYDVGTRVPLAILWPGAPAGRTTDEFVSLTDLAPTFLEIAGVERPAEMTGVSILSRFAAGADTPTEPLRDHVLFGKERHTPCQEAPDYGGYPCRGLRNADFLYIRNFTPERWPNGTPDYEHAAAAGNWLSDCDNSPTKILMAEKQDADAIHRRLYDLAFAKRPAEELYDVHDDPDQFTNVIDRPEYAAVRMRLAAQLEEELRSTGDPRVVGGVEVFEDHPYLGGAVQHPDWKAPPKPQ